jgi:hypothetical protein
LAPKIRGVQTARDSMDTTICPRAKWLLKVCNSYKLFMLNGMQPGPAAPTTFKAQNGRSAIDYILCTDPKAQLTFDPEALGKLSDHSLLLATLPGVAAARQKWAETGPRVMHKWKEGMSVSNYAHSAQAWEKYTEQAGFVQRMAAVIDD